jgi:DNA polymerase-3 subunit beta
MDAREFPQFPSFDAKGPANLPAAAIRGMIERTIFAVSTDETRYALNGVFVEEGAPGHVRMISTDGHRLAFEEQTLGGLGLPKGVILPRKGLGELRKLLESGDDGSVAIAFKDNMVLVSKDNVELFMRLIDGDFPDYKKVIPKGNPNLARIDHGELLQALKRVSILSSERYKGVKMDFAANAISISASNPDLGEAVEEIDAEYNGAPMSIGFNARYILDVLGVLAADGEITIELKDELSPSIIRRGGDEAYLYVLMPMRL